MKSSRDAMNKQSNQGFTKKPKPEIRDDMDSRENKEGNFRADTKTGKTLKKSIKQ